jgi:hypothetical protein
MKQLAQAISGRQYPGLHLKTQVLEGETRFSVYPAALSHGLRELYRQP